MNPVITGGPSESTQSVEDWTIRVAYLPVQFEDGNSSESEPQPISKPIQSGAIKSRGRRTFTRPAFESRR